MEPWFTEGGADDKEGAKQNVQLGISGCAARIPEPEKVIAAINAAIDALPAPARDEAVSVRAQGKIDADRLPAYCLIIEVAIYRKESK